MFQFQVSGQNPYTGANPGLFCPVPLRSAEYFDVYKSGRNTKRRVLLNKLIYVLKVRLLLL